MSSTDRDNEQPESVLSTEARVICSYCGADVVIVLDPGSGTRQRYVEDCPVCCHPWTVHVRYDAGSATVWLMREEDL
jgi:transposase-like protein